MEEKHKVIKAFGEVTGRPPANLNEVLNVLVHPDVVRHARAYLQMADTTDVCLKYQAPWTCVMESENISRVATNGWVGDMDEIMSNWCVNCRVSLFGEDPGDAIPMGGQWLEDTDQEPDNPWLVDCD